MLVNGMARTRSSLSQVLPGPTSPLSFAGSNLSKVQEFYNAIDRAYQYTEQALDTAKTGYNLDVATRELTGSGGASDWKERAYDYLKAAHDGGEISTDDAQAMLKDTLGPLDQTITDVKQAILEGGNVLTNTWNQFKNSSASIVAKVTGFWGQKWKNSVKSYRMILDLIQVTRDALHEIQSLGVDPAFDKILREEVETKLGTLIAVADHMRVGAERAGVPAGYLDKEAQALGILPAAGGAVAGGLSVGVIITTVVSTIALGALGAITFVLTTEGTLPGWMHSQAWLAQERIRRLKEEQAAVDELSRQKSEEQLAINQKQHDEIEKTIEKTANTAKGLNDLFPQPGLSRAEIDKKVIESRQKYGLPLSAGDYAIEYGPYIYAGLGGLLLAGAVYYFRTRMM